MQKSDPVLSYLIYFLLEFILNHMDQINATQDIQEFIKINVGKDWNPNSSTKTIQGRHSEHISVPALHNFPALTAEIQLYTLSKSAPKPNHGLLNMSSQRQLLPDELNEAQDKSDKYIMNNIKNPALSENEIKDLADNPSALGTSEFQKMFNVRIFSYQMILII